MTFSKGMTWGLPGPAAGAELQLLTQPLVRRGPLVGVQGNPADVGGYYRPDPAKAGAVMRPSATFNGALAAL